ncbi:ABC transporter ATP-binding protein [Pseudonocardia sp.]|uniref:ABC transporter ATP-binding protein n=1 Tax=Pseudonocardia sp. TaxID=60912 RepID=UPI003D09BC0B
MSVLELDDVAVHFGGIRAVDGISLTMEAGRIYGLLGPNGSGKSTLLAAVSGLVPLSRGAIVYAGLTTRRHSPTGVARSGVARTFQTVRLLADLTVLENVLLGIDRPGRPRPPWRSRGRIDRAAAVEALARVGLADLAGRRPAELSYGMQRRVEIARAIAMSPHLLLLDEPVAGMNHEERVEVRDVLVGLRDEGLTQLLVEHDVQMISETCDRVVAMNFGVLIAEGRPDEVVREPAVRTAYLGKRWGNRADGG